MARKPAPLMQLECKVIQDMRGPTTLDRLTFSDGVGMADPMASLTYTSPLGVAEESWGRSPRADSAPMSKLLAGGLAVRGELIHAAGRGPQDWRGTALFAIFIPAPVDAQQELDDFYRLEHVPLLLHCPQWLACRVYAVNNAVGVACTRLVLHQLADVTALNSEERAAARTPWRERIAATRWFRSALQRTYSAACPSTSAAAIVW